MNTPKVGDLHYFSGMPADIGQIVSTVTKTVGGVEKVMHMVQDPMGLLHEIESGGIKQLESLISSQGGIFSQFASMLSSAMR